MSYIVNTFHISFKHANFGQFKANQVLSYMAHNAGDQCAVITLEDECSLWFYIVALDFISGSPVLVVIFFDKNQEQQRKIRVISHPPVLSRHAGHRRDEPYVVRV